MATKKSATGATKKQAAPAKKTRVVAMKKKVGPAKQKSSLPMTSRSKSALVNKLLDAAEKKVEADDVKASIGDVIRLLQLQKELENEEPREITVQWIERQENKDVREP